MARILKNQPPVTPKINRIHILGASGVGTTSIARRLAERIDCQHFDSDDFYWRNTSSPYTVVYETQERQRRLSTALASHRQWILSGSLCGWGDMFIPFFELVVYVYVENETRLERIRQRESMRFGDAILPGGDQYERYREFVEWAAAYETSIDVSRNAVRHQQWLEKVNCPIVMVINHRTVDDAVNDIMAHMRMGN
ncbi:AAA family ATPase [Serratia fonticola]|uniref:AAA family ATPase n=1 Tax=Serratia fonticola TaxID=47917 RepID=UPI0015C5C5DE|nr:AAA family ATPase [Serratia fonticola]NXZ87309.1 AAA family ATPase [Serratia fonticola]